MKRKALALALIVAFLFSAVITVRFAYVGSAQTYGAIKIKPDGSVEGTDKIQQVGNVYTFAGNIYGLITVEKDDVEIDGAGYVLHRVDNEGGIVLENRKGVVLRNIEVVDATFGITIRNGSNIEITESNCR